jgi:hypothetical protein
MFGDFFDYLGSVYAKEEKGLITIGGIDTTKLLDDINEIWRNRRVPENMFKEIRKYRFTFDSFFAPDVLYQLEQISEYKRRESLRFRINQARNELFEQTWLKSLTTDHEDILDFTQLGKLAFTAKSTQLETLQEYNRKVPRMQLKGFLLGTPPGSGKTFMSIAISMMLHADVTIFVVPKNTVTTVWYDGIVEQLGQHVKIWSSEGKQPLTDDYDYYIFHYETLDKAMGLARNLRGIKKKPFIAIDEAHNLNEITSQRTLRLIELAKILDCQHTVFATGTPVKALGLEMIPLLRTIDRFFTPDVEKRFMAIYGATAKRANDILRNRLGLISHKIYEADYMTVPQPIEIEHKIKIPDPKPFLIENIKTEMKKFMEERYQFYRKNMGAYVRIYDEGLSVYERTLRTQAQRAEFQRYRDNVKIIIQNYDPREHGQIAKFVKEFEGTKIVPALQQPLKDKFKDALSIVKYAKLRVMGEFLGKLTQVRAECAAALTRHGRLDQIVTGADKKSIIFSSYIPALEVANKVFMNLGFKTLNVYGDDTKNIVTIVNQFKKDPEANPLLGTLKSLAASQTLVVANVVIFLDPPFREYIRNQAFHRVFRIGQDTQTYIYMCSLDTKEPNISNRSADILAWSQQQVSEIFGGTTREEAAGIIKQLHLNPPAGGLDVLLDMMRKVLPF